MRSREALSDRQGGYCWWCGGPLGLGFAVHHRKLRSQGGNDEVTNLVALHHPCHNLGSHAVHLNVARAVERGFIVPSWGDPATTPLTLPGGGSVTLTEGVTLTIGETHGW